MADVEVKEEILQRLPYRCPYCDQTVSYDSLVLKEGENPIQCPSCHKTYIKIVSRLSQGETE